MSKWPALLALALLFTWPLAARARERVVVEGRAVTARNAKHLLVLRGKIAFSPRAGGVYQTKAFKPGGPADLDAGYRYSRWHRVREVNATRSDLRVRTSDGIGSDVTTVRLKWSRSKAARQALGLP